MLKRLAVATMTAALGVALAQPVAAQDLDEVLAGHYAAIGGVDAWKNLQSMHGSGTLVIAGGMAQGPFTLVQKRPAMYRFDLSIQGMDVVQAYDGETAWEINPMLGQVAPTEADPSLAESVKENADLDGPLVGWQEDGHQVQVVGPETLGTVETIKLEVTANGNTSFYYLDAATHHLIQVESNAGGVSATTRLADYREVGGLMFPFAVQIDSPEFPMEMLFDSVEINVEVEDGQFSMRGS